MSAGDVTSSLDPEQLDGFAVHHGIRIASIGEDDDALLMGHHGPETAWAAFASCQVALGNWSTPADELLEHYEVRQALAAFSHHSEGCDTQAQQVCGPCAAEDHDACVSPCLCEDDYDHDDEGPSASPVPCSCEDEYAWWVTGTKTGHPVTWISWDWKAARERSARPARPAQPRRPTVADETTEIVQTLRRSAIRRLRYSGRRGARRLADVLDARDWEHRVMHLVGTEFCGNYDPPNAGTVRYPWMDEERVFSADNDGMELWFGYPSRWEWHIDSDEVRRLTRFLIVDWWIKARWLGLRRPIYYAALRSSVKRHKAKRDNTPAQTDPKEVGRG